MIKYFKELLLTLKSIDESLKQIAKCAYKRPNSAHGIKDVIVTAHWNDTYM